MTQEELQALCGVWQRRLRLQDWIVEVQVVRARDMATDGDHGNSLWNLTSRRAIIKLLDPIDYAPDGQNGNYLASVSQREVPGPFHSGEGAVY